jgi:signal peptidase I
MNPRRSVFREYYEALLIAAVFLGFTNTFLVKTFYIPSPSMEDTLLVGDHLFVNRFLYGPASTDLERRLLPSREPRRGDIVIFRSVETPTTDLVKRCVGLPGDRLEIVDKRLVVNGEPVEESGYAIHRDPQVFPNRAYLVRAHRRRDNFEPFVVPEGHFFFMGDNRDFSYDSRFWGPVPRHFVKGRALVVYWSYGGETPDGEWRSFGARARQLLATARGFIGETRWERTLHVVR